MNASDALQDKTPQVAGWIWRCEGWEGAMVDLTIAILTYNGEHLLPAAVASVDRQALPADITMEKLIVDNGSHIPVLAPTGWRVERLPQNGGNIMGTNWCLRAAQGLWVLFLANDVRLHTGCISRLWACRRFADQGLLQPILYQPDGKMDHAGMDWRWPGYGIRRRRFTSHVTQVVPNTCWLAPRDLVWFDHTLGISHEDVDVCLRLSREGHQHYVCPTATATHLMGQTIATHVKELQPYYRKARRIVIVDHYQGMDRLLRLAAVQGVEAVQGLVSHVPWIGRRGTHSRGATPGASSPDSG